ncbi:MAG TPA: RidA family protein [Thermoanaerobaculia bacterium]|nr:RidA family protein [Thermoanaerobaculia bacterium]
MTIVNPPELGRPRGYSNGVLAPAGGRALHVAGQVAWDGAQRIACSDFPGQFARALENVLAVVRAAGGRPEHLVEMTLYVTDRREYLAAAGAGGALGEAYRRLMGRHYPAMALVEVAGLLEPEAKVEIQAVAVLPPAGGEGSSDAD